MENEVTEKPMPPEIREAARKYYKDIYRGESREDSLRIVGFQDGVQWLWDNFKIEYSEEEPT